MWEIIVQSELSASTEITDTANVWAAIFVHWLEQQALSPTKKDPADAALIRGCVGHMKEKPNCFSLLFKFFHKIKGAERGSPGLVKLPQFSSFLLQDVPLNLLAPR